MCRTQHSGDPAYRIDVYPKHPNPAGHAHQRDKSSGSRDCRSLFHMLSPQSVTRTMKTYLPSMQTVHFDSGLTVPQKMIITD